MGGFNASNYSYLSIMRIEEACAIWAQTQAAMDKGMLGAPTFLVGQEMFWGNARVDEAQAWCATLRAG